MFDNFGLNRVIEPKGEVPVTAWKIDNSKEVYEGEVRLRIKLIHIEKSSFDQICFECAYDEELIKAKILDIIQKRGKLHNPFTDSGGMVFGTIDAMGPLYRNAHPDYRIGDEIVCNTTITCLPISIDSIGHIDYSYGELHVTGYAILFMNSPMFKRPKGMQMNYAMTILDEAGSVYAISSLVKKNMRVLLLGKDPITTLAYMGAIRHSLGESCYIHTIMDTEACRGLSPEELRPYITKYAQKFTIMDATNPIAAMEELSSEDPLLMDFTINCQDYSGSEVLSVLMTRDHGHLYFTNLKNGYSRAVLAAESMGKDITTYSLDQYSVGYDEFSLELLSSMAEDFKGIDSLYKKSSEADIAGSRILTQRKQGQTASLDGFVYASPVTQAIANQAINIAGYDCNVIIQGETGVGKEKMLDLIHKNSNRRTNSCVKINCATIQENLAESEFFGYEPGSFTGAQAGGKKGYFELANNGTLFLDEIGQLSPALQSKLLRVIQEGSFYRIGGVKPVNVNVRVICANNIPLHTLVEEKKFREDLYYRLNICSIDVPPLRERKEDIPALAQNFLSKYNKQYGIYKEMTSGAVKRLFDYDWPGNVRELENKMHRIIINSRSDQIDIADVDMIINEGIYQDLTTGLKESFEGRENINFGEIIAAQEIKLIKYALEHYGSTRKAAAFLSMTQAQLMRKKQKYQL